MESKKENLFEKTRRKRKSEILEAAKQLLIERGYYNVNMSDIAKNISVTRQTLYKYFDSIDKIIFALQIELLSDMVKINDYNELRKQSPVDAIINCIIGCLKYAENHPDETALMFSFDSYNRKRACDDKLELEYKHGIRGGRFIQEQIERGIESGDIKETLDSEIAYVMIFNTAVGFIERVSLIGIEKFNYENDINVKDVASELCAAIRQYLSK